MSAPAPAQGSGPGGPPLWPPGEHCFPADGLDAFLLWAAGQGASDVSLQTGERPRIEVHGSLRAAAASPLDAVAMERVAARLYDVSADGVLRSGRPIDCSYAVQVSRGERRRFRVNMTPVLARGAYGVNVTMRVLPDAPPTLDELGVEPGIAEAWQLCRGLTLVTGVPGSGKSTLMAAGTRRLLEAGVGRVQSYEAPVEFAFDGIAGGGAMMSQTEIPRHVESFAEGVRSSLRRRPAAVVVGEARDRETVETVVRAADTGIAVYTTAHTIGVAATVRRLLAEFPPEERAERGAALVDVVNMVVTQILVPAAGGGRVALREWFVFPDGLRRRLLETPQETWPAAIDEALAATGQDMGTALARAHAAGRIDDATLHRHRPGRA